MSVNYQNFQYWKKLHDNDKLEEFSINLSGLLWLKIKSILRKEIFQDFLKNQNLKLNSTNLDQNFIEIYELLVQNLENSHHNLDVFIKQKNQEWLKDFDENKLVSELYKLRSFNWGGDYKNALDRYLVDRYIKVYSSYDDLVGKFDTDISRAVQGYVLCSWYNHWSSILIENIFKSHSSVLPTVGQIKKVDFFVNNIPFDLKVTYLPANFIEKKRKEKGLKTELIELKTSAKQAIIDFDKTKNSSDIYYEIVEKMKNRGDSFCLETLEKIKKVRLEILNEIINNPKELVQNLYEEQGELRFDASNRLFLVLIDTEDFDNSWKLKRNLDLLKPTILSYLDNFHTKKLDDLKINFDYKNKGNFTATSDVIFMVK